MTSLRSINSKIWVRELTFDDFDVRSVLLLGNTQAVIWDTLTHPKDLAPILDKLGNSKLNIIYSHADWDHIWGTAGLPYQNANIIGHAACFQRFSEDVPSTLQQRARKAPEAVKGIKLLPPTLSFTHDLSLKLGGLTLNLHHLPGHTQDSIVGFIVELGVLLMGDIIETPFPEVPPNADLTAWINGLKKWEADPRVTTVIPSHGPIAGRELISHNIAYLKQLQSGQEIRLPDNLNSFYRETHTNNLFNSRR